MVLKALPLALLVLSAASAASADVFHFVDADGIPHFSDRPDDPRAQLFLRATPPATATQGARRAAAAPRHDLPRNLTAGEREAPLPPRAEVYPQF